MKIKAMASFMLLLVITAILFTTNAVDTSNLNYLINMGLHKQLCTNNSVNLEELEQKFYKKCQANDAEENVKQMQLEFSMIEDHLKYLKNVHKSNDFCAVRDQIKTSVYNFANYAKDCLPVKDKKRANILNKIIKILDDFFCFKDGDRLLMFLAENGDDCLKKSEEVLKACSRENFGTDFNSTTDYARLLYFFTVENKCSVMDSYWSCIVNDINNNCKSTIARILSDILDSIKFTSSCNKTKLKRRDVADDEALKLQNFFKNRCTNADYQRFLDGINSISYCFQTGYQRAHSTPDPKEFCKEDEKILKDCLYKGIEQISSCFRDEEKFLKGFFKKSLKNMLKFVCEDDAKHLKAYFSDTGKVCSKKIVEASNRDDGELEHCLDRIFSPSGKSVTQEEICRDLGIAEECTFRYINKTCPENAMYQKLGKSFIHSLQAPCGSSTLVSWSLFVLVFLCVVIDKIL